MRRILLGLGTVTALTYGGYLLIPTARKETTLHIDARTAPKAPRPLGGDVVSPKRADSKKSHDSGYFAYTEKGKRRRKARVDETMQESASFVSGDISRQPIDLGLKLADEGHAMPAVPLAKVSQAKGFSKTLPKRWVQKVSGPGAKVQVYETAEKKTCSAKNTTYCQRREVHDAHFTGIVVSTDKLAEHSSEPLEGELRAGHVVEATPAIYLE